MVRPETLESNRIHLEANKRRLQASLVVNSKRLEDKEQVEEGAAYNTISLRLHNHKATRDQLEVTELALKKMEDGTYGICEKCGKDIDEDRLIALPGAILCYECRKELENPLN